MSYRTGAFCLQLNVGNQENSSLPVPGPKRRVSNPISSSLLFFKKHPWPLCCSHQNDIDCLINPKTHTLIVLNSCLRSEELTADFAKIPEEFIADSFQL